MNQTEMSHVFKLQGWTPLYLVTVLLKINFNLFFYLSHNQGAVISGKGLICHLTQLSLLVGGIEVWWMCWMMLQNPSVYYFRHLLYTLSIYVQRTSCSRVLLESLLCGGQCSAIWASNTDREDFSPTQLTFGLFGGWWAVSEDYKPGI